MFYWILGAFFVAMFVAVVVEQVLNRRRGWEEEGESQDE